MGVGRKATGAYSSVAAADLRAPYSTSRDGHRDRMEPGPTMKFTVVFLLLKAFFALVSAQDNIRVTAASNEFAFRLLPHLSSSPEKNIFYSPYSIATALAMTYAGAGSTSLQELHDALGYTAVGLDNANVLGAHAQHNRQLLAPSNSTLKIANAAAVDGKLNILPAYAQALQKGFGAELIKVDFSGAGQEAVNTINSWVNQKTQRKISTLFKEKLSSDTRLVLLDAIYFKGTWHTKFDASKTAKAPFYTDGTQSTNVDTMQGIVKAGYAYSRGLGASLLDMPYNGFDYSMSILLPVDRAGVESVKEKLTLEEFRKLLYNLREATVQVHLPRFKLEEEYKLKKVLPKVGIQKVFDKSQADLSGINGGRDLFVDEVVHKAVVEVNEEGSEAAAVTGVVINTRTIGGPLQFRADHPFLFFIRNTRTGDLLFMGQVNRV
uniref:Serine protease inhibitor n=1 Tax=Amblyomma americanum TaxID=6943 RepID=A0A0E9Y224_AMBAM